MTNYRLLLAVPILLLLAGCPADDPGEPSGSTEDTGAAGDLGEDSQDVAADTSSDAADDSSEDVAPPFDPFDLSVEESGPFAPGYRTWDVTYTPQGRDDRTVEVHVWYPTEDVRDEAAPPLRYVNVVRDNDSIPDAVPADPAYDGGYPVLVYSHGDLGFPQDSNILFKFFVSHGWIAIAVGHTPNTILEARSDLPITHWHDRAQDISAALDALEDLADDDALAGLAWTNRTLVTGHSRGSYGPWPIGGAVFDMDAMQSICDDDSHPCSESDLARFETGFRDQRVLAGIPTAGDGRRGFFDGVDGMDDTEIPIMMITAENDQRGIDRLFEDLSDDLDLTWIELAEGCHILFTVGCGGSQDTRGFPPLKGYTLAFGRHHVLDDDSAAIVSLLDGSHTPWDNAVFVTK